jgi:hypothetical protein
MLATLKISPHPSLTKRGNIPPFGKGRLGGIFTIVGMQNSEYRKTEGWQ